MRSPDQTDEHTVHSAIAMSTGTSLKMFAVPQGTVEDEQVQNLVVSITVGSACSNELTLIQQFDDKFEI